nr:hypothetical protein [Pseudomonas fluorescens]
MYPDFLATFADALVLAGIEFAAPELVPEQAVFSTSAVGWIDKQAVMLPLDLGQGIAQRVQEVVVGVQNLAIQRELDNGLRFVDGVDLPF